MAIPRRFLLLANVGTKKITFCRVEPGWIGHPSLKMKKKNNRMKNLKKLLTEFQCWPRQIGTGHSGRGQHPLLVAPLP